MDAFSNRQRQTNRGPPLLHPHPISHAQAARWRQQQRAQAAPPRKVVVWEVDELQPWEEPEEPSGLAALLPGPWVRPRELKINLKQRIAGVLEQDRDEGWGEDAEP
uniref:Uncharacterized protein n=1 Tax=Auxenochlorella protothecoides TaxID=3075 RepID=A0A1D2AGJ7_AUXPR